MARWSVVEGNTGEVGGNRGGYNKGLIKGFQGGRDWARFVI